MNIQEAQEISRTHGISNCSDARKGNIMLYLSTEQYNAICTIEAALDNGYVLCKVDDFIERSEQMKALYILTQKNSSSNIAALEAKEYSQCVDNLIAILKGACE